MLWIRIWTRIGSGFSGVPRSVSGSGSRRAKICVAPGNELVNLFFLSAGCSLLRAEVFCCSLGISKLQFMIKTNFHLYFFLKFLVIKILDLNGIRIRTWIHLKCWIRIRIQWIQIHSSGYYCLAINVLYGTCTQRAMTSSIVRQPLYLSQWVTKRCRLSWLTSSAFVYTVSPNAGEGGLRGLSQWVYRGAHGAQINFWRSNSIFNLRFILIEFIFCLSMLTRVLFTASFWCGLRILR